MTFAEIVQTVGKVIDAAGVAVIVAGTIVALATTVARRPSANAYEFFRRRLGRSILLGLEFLVAGDIIRTVAVNPTGESVAVLGGIVLIRTFLSFSLQAEISGIWPWLRRAVPAGDQGER